MAFSVLVQFSVLSMVEIIRETADAHLSFPRCYSLTCVFLLFDSCGRSADSCMIRVVSSKLLVYRALWSAWFATAGCWATLGTLTCVGRECYHALRLASLLVFTARSG